MSSTTLPPDLAHWQSIVDRLIAIPPDRLNKEADLDFVFAYLEERFSVSTVADCDEVLEREHRRLNEISQQPGADPALGFLVGIVTPHISDSIARDLEVEAPPLVVAVTLPDQFICEEDFGSVSASYDDLSLRFIPTAASTFDFRRNNLVRQGYSCSQFERGKVAGWKLEKAYPQHQLRYLNYFLEVPGGAVHVEMELTASPSPDPKLEATFDTLAVRSNLG